jgi:hypothetical protein
VILVLFSRHFSALVTGDIKIEVVVSKVSDNKDIVLDVLTNDKCRRQIIALQTHTVSNVMKALYIAKENDKEAAWNIIQSSKPPGILPQSKFEEGFALHVREVQNANDEEKLKKRN